MAGISAPVLGRMSMPADFEYRDVFLRGRPCHDGGDAFSLKHPPMPASKWAKIFSPFDALKGFSEAISNVQKTGGAEKAPPAGGRTMCCRYCMELSPELRPYIEAANRSPLKEKLVDRLGRPMVVSGEVRPADLAPVIAPDRAHAPGVFPMVWGFHLSRSSAPLINARVETAMEKPLFRESWVRRRCAVPASWYFEWEHLAAPSGRVRTGDKYMIQPRGGRLSFLAGLYRIEETDGFPLPVFTVLTREPPEEIRFIHDRMPVILPEASVRDWVNPECRPEDVLEASLLDMVFEKVV